MLWIALNGKYSIKIAKWKPPEKTTSHKSNFSCSITLRASFPSFHTNHIDINLWVHGHTQCEIKATEVFFFHKVFCRDSFFFLSQIENTLRIYHISLWHFACFICSELTLEWRLFWMKLSPPRASGFEFSCYPAFPVHCFFGYKQLFYLLIFETEYFFWNKKLKRRKYFT